MTTGLPSGLVRPCLLFDLDGTLVDAFEAVVLSLNAVRRSLGYHTVPAEDIVRLVGRGEQWLLSQFFSREELPGAMELYRQHHQQVLIHHSRPLPFASEILKEATQQGLPCSLVTNRPHAQALLIVQALGWSQYLTAIIGAREDRPLKPHPAMVYEAIKRMPAPQDGCVLIGDTRVDAEAAAAAGIAFIGVATGAEPHEALRDAGAMKVFDDLQACWRWLARTRACSGDSLLS